MSHVKPLLQEMTSAYLERKKMRARNPEPVSSGMLNHATDMHLLCAIAKLLPYKDQPEQFDHLSKEALCKEAFDKPALIEDNRAEIEEVMDYLESQSAATSALQELKDNTNRVVLVIPKDDLSDLQDNPNAKRYKIKSKALKDRSVFINGTAYAIGSSQYLDQQTVGALGTGIFIDENTILTAAHVLFPPFLELELADIRFVVGYKVHSTNKMDEYVSVDKTNVYQVDIPAGKEGKAEDALDYTLTSFGQDWAKIKVVKENGNPNYPYTPIKFGSVKANQHVYGLGHGLGLPLKMSYCGNVIDAAVEDNASIFKCTLDFYSGNSGSPIFDSTTHELIGIHVRGQREFFFTEEDGTKKVKAAVFSSTKGNIGEECQSVAALTPFA